MLTASKRPTSMLFYCVESGYLDGIARGYRSSLLSSVQYSNFSQCETLEDLKLQLAGTDYGNFLQNEPSPITTSVINDKLLAKFVEDFNYLRLNAAEPLSQFLEYITYGYMIDNVILLITGTLHERDTNELLERCHPLGRFDSMAALCVANNVVDLYQTVLVETPLAPYFANCLSAQDFDEMNIEIIRNTLYKAYIEDFYDFCENKLSGDTAETMKEILKFEADRRILNITINSFGTELTKDDRLKLYPKIGRFYPEGIALLAKADDLDQIRAVCDKFSEYRSFFDVVAGSGGDKTLDDVMFEHEVALNKLTFQQHFNYAIFYSLVRLKEQEIRNIVWISECIAQHQKDKIMNYIPIF